MSVTSQPTLQRPARSDAPPEAATGRRLAPVVVAVVPTAVVTLLIVLSHPRWLYTSDSTAQESIVRTWLDAGHGLTFVPRDCWALKVPLYLLVEQLPMPALDRLLTIVLVVNVITYLVLGRAVWKLAAGTTAGARWYEVCVPLLWLVSIGGGLSTNRMTPNYRNVELGLGFLMLALIAAYLGELGDRTASSATSVWARTIPRKLTLGLLSALLIGVLGFDDPYVTLLVAAPMMVAALAWYALRVRDQRLLHVAAVLAASFVVTGLLRAIAEAAGIRFDDNLPTLALAPSDLSWHLSLLPSSVNVLLGTGFWDSPPTAWLAQALVLVVAAVLLVVSAVLAWWGWRQQRFVVTFIAAHWPFVLAGFLVSWHTQDRSAGRYLVLAVFDLAVAAAIFLPRLRIRRPGASAALAGLLAVSTAAGLFYGTTTAIDRGRRPNPALLHQQAVVQAVERAVDEHGAVKGYAPFWSANITSYLVGRGTTAVELTCRQGVLRTRQWLSDTARLTRPAKAVFVIWDPVDLTGCPASVRDAQLGLPIADYPVTRPPVAGAPGGGATSVLVYASDIVTRVPDLDGRPSLEAATSG